MEFIRIYGESFLQIQLMSESKALITGAPLCAVRNFGNHPSMEAHVAARPTGDLWFEHIANSFESYKVEPSR